MPKRGRIEAFVENDDDYCNVSKRYRHEDTNFKNQVKCRSFESYRHLIKNSTKKFRSKHLITDTKNRQRLKEMCQKILRNKKYNGPHSKVYANHQIITSDLSRAVSESCQGLAKKRFLQLLQLGEFNVGGSGTRNTIVVSASEKILLHIEKSVRPRFHLWFKIEQKNSLDHHLTRNRSGLINHYQK